MKLRFVLLTLILGACSDTEPGSFLKAVIGEDDRVRETDETWKSILGTIDINGRVCTGYFSGPQKITTAAHCFALDRIEDYQTVSFRTAKGKVYQLETIDLYDAKKDIATLSISETSLTWLESSLYSEGPVQLIGFDLETGSLLANESCQVEKEMPEAGVLIHSCDTTGGWSGAPVIQNGKAVGIHLGYKESLDRNVAFDFRYLGSDTSDVLLLEIKQECHSRAHSRGGIGGHSRAHNRNCVPVPSPIPGPVEYGAAGRIAYPAAAKDTAAKNPLVIPLHGTQIEKLKHFFPENDLRAVRVHYSASLTDSIGVQGLNVRLDSDGQAFGYDIYINGAMNYGSCSQQELIAHEIQHVMQFKQRNHDYQRFGHDYFYEYAKAGNSYRNNALEVEAYNMGKAYADMFCR